MSIVLGTRIPAGFRAAEASRVMRIEPHDYHAIAAVAPEVGERVGALASNRISGRAGLQGSRPEPPPPRRSWSATAGTPPARELRRFLDRNQIVPVAPAGRAATRRSVGRRRCRPRATARRSASSTARPSCGRSCAAWPSCSDIATEPEAAEYDTVIVGAGPAGLAAAVYGASEGLRTIVVEREAPGGQAGTSSRIENYLGFPSGVSGDELASRALQQARRLGAEILVTRSITRIDAATRQIHLDGGDVLAARTIILACGVSWRQLEIEGFERLVGKGIFYGAARSEASNTHGLDVHIIGAGNSAGQAAMFFSTHARSVTILYRGETLEKSMSRYLVDQLATRPNIHVRYRSRGDGRARRHVARGDRRPRLGDGRDDPARVGRAVHLHRRGRRDRVAAAGDRARSEAATCSPAPMCARPAAGSSTATRTCWRRASPASSPAATSAFSPVKRVAAAVGEGSMAIAFVHQYLRDAAVRAGE